MADPIPKQNLWIYPSSNICFRNVHCDYHDAANVIVKQLYVATKRFSYFDKAMALLQFLHRAQSVSSQSEADTISSAEEL